MLHVVRCVLHVARCMLHVACCALHVACCALRAAAASGDLRPLYKRLAQKYRMLIYSGDVDACERHARQLARTCGR
jgi:hypothetical protein